MDIELEEPFCGPHISVRVVGGSHSKSVTLPSAVNTTLNGSPVATTFGASRVRFWAPSAAQANNRISVRYLFIFMYLESIFYQFFSF